uniref:Forkhead box protein O n=1 Tax=Bursaphelenchus xylophilus TaxID=6326 RepID=H2DMI6_BURXY|nr:daf-16-1 protein 2 [Bursaphelenchus xylophilus]
MDELDDLSTEMRGRCYTWPMQQYSMSQALVPCPSHGLSVQDAPSSSYQSMTSISSSMCTGSLSHGLPSVASLDPWVSTSESQLFPYGYPHPQPSTSGSMLQIHDLVPPLRKKRIRRRNPDSIPQKKPNPWGEDSYSDLIAKALESAPGGRMKLNEIYQWFSDNVPYFKERSSQEHAAGWKNSIRHNLSLHSRFMRIQNEGAGKSSWWVINPDAKPGRNPRRRSATMETTTKTILDKKRRGVRKRMDMVNESSLSSLNESAQSQRDFLDRDEGLGASDYEPFRSRTQSNVSMPGQRMTPPMEGFEDYKFPPWSGQQISQPASGATINDLLDRTDQIRLDTEEFRQMRASGQLVHPVKTEQKNEPPSNQQPFYQELCVVRGPDNLQNPLLCNQFSMSASSAPKPASMQCASNASFYPYGVHNSQNRLWNSTNPVNSMALNSNGLPIDLENVNTFESSNLDYDMEAVLRHELNSANGLSFDL